MMTKLLIVIAAVLMVFPCTAMAQRGTAEPGYYPTGYGGDVWTGKVTAADNDSREITLTYIDRKKKEHNFSAILPAEYKLKMEDGLERAFNVEKLLGFTIRVYYLNKTIKEPDGQRIKRPEIFRLLVLPDPK